MKIIITESQHRYLSEQGGLGRAITNGVEKGVEWLSKLLSKGESQLGKPSTFGKILSGAERRMGEVAVKNLPYEVESMISKLPTEIIFTKNAKPILQDNVNMLGRLHGSVNGYYEKLGNGSGLGTAEIRIRFLENEMSSPVGKTVNLKKMVDLAYRIEMDLIESKVNFPKPKDIAKNKQSIEDWYNYLNLEIRDIKKVISNFKELVKNAKLK